MNAKLRFFERPWNAAVYLLAAGALVVDVGADSSVPLFVMGGLFFVWDIGYVLDSQALSGRDPRRLDDLITTGRTYMSWYMLFFGVFFGLLLTGDVESRTAFVDLCEKARVSLSVLVSPLVLMTIAVLFIPIQVGVDRHSPALKSLFVIVIFCQQMSTFLLLHCLIRLTLASGHIGPVP